MPLLATPADTYTVLSLAQVGTGDAATLTTALEPLQPSRILNHRRSNPLPRRSAQRIQGPGTNYRSKCSMDELTPVEGLSVVMSDGELLLVTELTDSNGHKLRGAGRAGVADSGPRVRTRCVTSSSTRRASSPRMEPSSLWTATSMGSSTCWMPSQMTRRRRPIRTETASGTTDPNPTVPDVDPEDILDEVSEEDVEGGLPPLEVDRERALPRCGGGRRSPAARGDETL